jgi:dsRNA-specific ribonuclease
MSRELFLAYRHLPPGPLTRLRAANVDKEKLARVAVDRGIHRFLRHKAPQLDGQVSRSLSVCH